MVISLPPDGAPGTGRQQHHLPGMPFGTRGGFVIDARFPGGRRVRAHDRRHGARARSAAHGVREHGRRAARRRGVLSHEHRRRERTTRRSIRRSIRPSRRSTAGCARSASTRRPVSTSSPSRSCTAASPRATSARARSRSRAARSASRPRTRCEIRGPLEVTGIGDSQSRQKIFICQPTEGSASERARREIVTNLAERAFRRPVNDADLDGLMAFYDAGYQRRRLRNRRPRRAVRGPREPALHLSRGVAAKARARSR